MVTQSGEQGNESNVLESSLVKGLLAADEGRQLLHQVESHGIAAGDEVAELLQERKELAHHLLLCARIFKTLRYSTSA